MSILKTHIYDHYIFNLVEEIVHSFSCGLPLGNLTSQLFINIYLNELDRFVKHNLKLKHYIRYADDIVIFHNCKKDLREMQNKLDQFLQKELFLTMHKISIKSAYAGVDFLGFKHFKKHRILRRSTEKKMWKNLNEGNVNSYMGMLSWGNCKRIEKRIGGILEKRKVYGN